MGAGCEKSSSARIEPNPFGDGETDETCAGFLARIPIRPGRLGSVLSQLLDGLMDGLEEGLDLLYLETAEGDSQIAR